jgi:hypothetical protein
MLMISNNNNKLHWPLTFFPQTYSVTTIWESGSETQLLEHQTRKMKQETSLIIKTLDIAPTTFEAKIPGSYKFSTKYSRILSSKYA